MQILTITSGVTSNDTYAEHEAQRQYNFQALKIMLNSRVLEQKLLEHNAALRRSERQVSALKAAHDADATNRMAALEQHKVDASWALPYSDAAQACIKWAWDKKTRCNHHHYPMAAPTVSFHITHDTLHRHGMTIY